MKCLLISLLFVLAAAGKSCRSASRTAAVDSLASLPACIRQKIDSIRREPVWNPPAEVHSYRYNGQTVYFFSSNCCDNFNMVVDEQCRYLCAPSGGLTGKGDRRCPDFNEKAQHLKLVWKDGR